MWRLSLYLILLALASVYPNPAWCRYHAPHPSSGVDPPVPNVETVSSITTGTYVRRKDGGHNTSFPIRDNVNVFHTLNSAILLIILP